MADEERPAPGPDRPGDPAEGRREGNPLEREVSFARGRGAVLREGRGDSTSGRAGSPRRQSEEGGEDSRPGTYRQRLMAEYRERQRAHQDEARDESEQDG